MRKLLSDRCTAILMQAGILPENLIELVADSDKKI